MFISVGNIRFFLFFFQEYITTLCQHHDLLESVLKTYPHKQFFWKDKMLVVWS